MKNFKGDNHGEGSGHHSYQCAHLNMPVSKTIRATTLSVSVQTISAQVRCYTGVSSRRFTRTNKSSKIQTLDFTRVNSASVISAGRRGAPDAYPFAISKLQEGGVFSLNGIDILPAHIRCGQGVMNSNSLIKDFNSGSVQNNINNQGKKRAPSESTRGVCKTLAGEALNTHPNQQSVGDIGCHEGAFGSKEITIVHGHILSGNAGVSHV